MALSRTTTFWASCLPLLLALAPGVVGGVPTCIPVLYAGSGATQSLLQLKTLDGEAVSAMTNLISPAGDENQGKIRDDTFDFGFVEDTMLVLTLGVNYTALQSRPTLMRDISEAVATTASGFLDGLNGTKGSNTNAIVADASSVPSSVLERMNVSVGQSSMAFGLVWNHQPLHRVRFHAADMIISVQKHLQGVYGIDTIKLDASEDDLRIHEGSEPPTTSSEQLGLIEADSALTSRTNSMKYAVSSFSNQSWLNWGGFRDFWCLQNNWEDRVNCVAAIFSGPR